MKYPHLSTRYRFKPTRQAGQTLFVRSSATVGSRGSWDLPLVGDEMYKNLHRTRWPNYWVCVLVSIVESIPACHAGDRGSIPRRGGQSLFGLVSWPNPQSCICIFLGTAIKFSSVLLTWKDTPEVALHMHWWFSGRILACHAGGPGSIPGRCKLSFCI